MQTLITILTLKKSRWYPLVLTWPQSQALFQLAPCVSSWQYSLLSPRFIWRCAISLLLQVASTKNRGVGMSLYSRQWKLLSSIGCLVDIANALLHNRRLGCHLTKNWVFHEVQRTALPRRIKCKMMHNGLFAKPFPDKKHSETSIAESLQSYISSCKKD